MAKVVKHKIRKNSTLKTQPRKYAKKHAFRKGSHAYNAYVYGTASHRFAQAYAKRSRGRSRARGR